MDPDSSSSTPAPQPYYDLPVTLWEPAQHDKKLRKDDWASHPSGMNVSGDESSRTPKDGPPTPTSFDFTHGKWRQAKIRLFCDPPRNTPYDAPNKLVISFPDSPYPLEPIHIYRMFQSDIRRTHYSVFCQNYVIGIHRRTGQAYGIPPISTTPDSSQSLLNAPGSHAGFQTSSPWTISANFLQPQSSRLDSLYIVDSPVSMQSNDPASFPPLYIKFPSAEVHDTWFALLHAHSVPETFVNGVPSLPTFDEEAVQYRKWRRLTLNIDWLEGLNGFEEGGVREGPSSSSSKDSLSGSHWVDFDFYCDVLIDGLLVGRTTIKRWSRPLNSSMRVDWHERFELSELPSLGTLQLLIWKMKAEKAEKERAPTQSVSGSDSQRQRLTSLASSSISAGVAFISHAVGFGHKERQRICIGQVQIALSDFTRGETVDGKWEVTSFGSRIPWRIGPPLTTWLKLKVEECNIMPLKAYSELSSFLKPSETFLLLDQSCFTKGKGTPSFQKACLPTLQRCLYDLSVEDSTIIQDASHILTSEIAKLWEKTAAHPGSSVNNTLFRSGAVHSKVVELIMTNLGHEWLVNSLGQFIQDVIADKSISKSGHAKNDKKSGKEGSGNPTSDYNSALAKAKVDEDVLMSWCDKAWCYIWNARDQCPNELRQIFFTIRSEIESRFNPKPAKRLFQVSHSKPRKDYSTSATAEDSPEYSGSADAQGPGESKYENFKFQVISGFAFLRFFSPALLNPHLYHLSHGRLDDNVGDILKAVARALQQLANLTQGHSAEPVLREFSRKYSGDMVDYLQSISTVLMPAPSTSNNQSSKQTSTRETPRVSPAVNHALQFRLKSLPPLHQESVPALPHLVDRARCLAMIVSTVARHTRDDDIDESVAPTSMTTEWLNLQCISLRVEEQRLRCGRINPSKSPEEDGQSFAWAVDEDVLASPASDSAELPPQEPETIQHAEKTTQPTSQANQRAVKPSPALSQVSTFTSNTTLSQYLDYYLRQDENSDAERVHTHEAEYRPRSNRRPSTAPAAQRLSHFPNLSTTFESSPLTSQLQERSPNPAQRESDAARSDQGRGISQPPASGSASSNDFASPAPSVPSVMVDGRERASE